MPGDFDRSPSPGEMERERGRGRERERERDPVEGRKEGREREGERERESAPSRTLKFVVCFRDVTAASKASHGTPGARFLPLIKGEVALLTAPVCLCAAFFPGFPKQVGGREAPGKRVAPSSSTLAKKKRALKVGHPFSVACL